MQVARTTETSLIDIYRRIKDKLLLLPPHQRGDVWDSKKKESWWDKIKSGGTISGMITVYRIKSQDSAVSQRPESEKALYFNDGAQRCVYCLPQLRNQCESTEEFERYLRASYITEQQVIYENEAEAIEQFFILNATGTICTPFELTKGIFVRKLPDFDIVWVPLIERMNDIVNACLTRAGCKKEDVSKKRVQMHKRLRDNYSLLYRFMSSDTERYKRYAVASTHINMSEWSKETELEEQLSDLFVQRGSAKVSEDLDLFEKALDAYTAFYKQVWEEIKPKLTAPGNVHFRWWLLVAILFKNLGIDQDVLRGLTSSIISHTNGRTSVYYKDASGQQKNCNCALSNMSNLTTIMKAIGVDPAILDKTKSRPRAPQATNLIPGAANSHVKAFSVHGDGATLPENSIENNKRLNRDMSSDELERLIALNPNNRELLGMQDRAQ